MVASTVATSTLRLSSSSPPPGSRAARVISSIYRMISGCCAHRLKRYSDLNGSQHRGHVHAAVVILVAAARQPRGAGDLVYIQDDLGVLRPSAEKVVEQRAPIAAYRQTRQAGWRQRPDHLAEQFGRAVAGGDV